jgi:hypothetical protein
MTTPAKVPNKITHSKSLKLVYVDIIDLVSSMITNISSVHYLESWLSLESMKT